jgi:predicted CopG family antitoxin
MAKTTINLEDDVYKKLVKEAVEKYGTTRTLSKLINEKLRKAEKSEVSGSVGIVKKTFGAWGKGPSGKEFVKKLRKESEERLERLGL